MKNRQEQEQKGGHQMGEKGKQLISEKIMSYLLFFLLPMNAFGRTA